MLYIVIQYANVKNPSRCFVRFFKLYLSRCQCTAPADVFYLDKRKTEVWYSNKATGYTVGREILDSLIFCILNLRMDLIFV